MINETVHMIFKITGAKDKDLKPLKDVADQYIKESK